MQTGLQSGAVVVFETFAMDEFEKMEEIDLHTKGSIGNEVTLSVGATAVIRVAQYGKYGWGG